MEISSPTIRESDLEKFSNGTSTNLWEILGSHIIGNNTRFSVWAPNALKVFVNEHEMQPTTYGIWEVTVPEDLTGIRYSYFVHLMDGTILEKFDPMSIRNEVHPDRRSIVHKSDYSWGDQDWITSRKTYDLNASPMVIYEVHLNSWKKGLSYRQLADQLVGYVVSMGFTHVQIMPIADYPFTPSWGYQITGFYAPTAFFGEPDDLKFLIDSFHQAGIGVILDWVSYHFPRDDYGLHKYDGTDLYSLPESDPDQVNNLWTTDIFDYSKPEVQSFLISNVAYWAKEFHIDGFRFDAVAPIINYNSRKIGNEIPGMLPDLNGIKLIHSINTLLKEHFNGVFSIGEETQNWPDLTKEIGTSDTAMGFTFKPFLSASWLMLALYLPFNFPEERFGYSTQIRVFKESWNENHIWQISHDDVHHGCWGNALEHLKRERELHFAENLLLSYILFILSAPGKSMFFMGTEICSTRKWDPENELEWEASKNTEFSEVIRKAITTYKNTPALYVLDFDPQGTKLVADNRENDRVIVFSRTDYKDTVICAYNFSTNSYSGYQLPELQGVLGTELANSTGAQLKTLDLAAIDLPAGSARWFLVSNQ